MGCDGHEGFADAGDQRDAAGEDGGSPAGGGEESVTRYARHDRTHCLATGLFTLYPKGAHRKRKLDLTVQQPNGGSIKFWGPEPLSAFDLRVLQGLVAYAGVHGIDVRAQGAPDPAVRKKLSDALENVVHAIEAAPRLFVRLTFAQLAREIGLDPETQRHYCDDIRRSLERIAAVTVIYISDDIRVTTHMISTLAVSRRRGALYAALNTFVSQAVVGGRFANIPMDEVRALRTDAARILHQRFCAAIFETGEARKFSLEKLVFYVYAEADVATRSARFRRERVIIAAMDELAALGWAVKRDDNDVYTVRRERRAIPQAMRRPAKQETKPVLTLL